MTAEEFWKFAVDIESNSPVHSARESTWVSANDPEFGVVIVRHISSRADQPAQLIRIEVQLDDRVAVVEADMLNTGNINHRFIVPPTEEFCVAMVLRLGDFSNSDDYYG